LPTVYLGLGSNLGDRRNNITAAISALRRCGVTIKKIATVIETEPEGGPPQGKYLNTVVKATTELPALELLTRIQAIESELGRVRSVPNGPRTIDIDILLYGQERINSPDLIIPHPRMHQRDFVMTPLREIEPQLAKGSLHAHHH